MSNQNRKNNRNTQPNHGATKTGSLFDQFYQRAQDVGGSDSRPLVTRKPFIIEGLVTVPAPSFKNRIALMEAFRTNDQVRLLQILFGNDVNKVINEINEHEEKTGQNGNDIMMGIIIKYFEHFYGAGASEDFLQPPSI